MSYLLGYDIGSSAVKAALVETEDGAPLGAAVSPADELSIQAPRPGWAEQDPHVWWTHVVSATQQLAAAHPAAMREIKAIGLSYQMHGLVLVDNALQVLRPAILWCAAAPRKSDTKPSRARHSECMRQLLNSPGNFTASRLKWVKDMEPDVFAECTGDAAGDYVALRMKGIGDHTLRISEGMLWDYSEERFGADGAVTLRHFRFPIFQLAWESSRYKACCGPMLRGPGNSSRNPLAYRSGDQPNNALALNVLEPVKWRQRQERRRLSSQSVTHPTRSAAAGNTFLHVTHLRERPRYGTLLCITEPAAFTAGCATRSCLRKRTTPI